MKKIYIVIVLMLVAGLTLPLWGSCDLNAKVCSSWCSIRHYSSDLKTASCKAGCTTDRLRCLTDQGSQEVERLIDELGK